MEFGYVLINVLGAAMVITSLLILFAKTPKSSAVIYCVQAIMLVALFFTMAATVGSTELYEWGVTSIFTKVIFVPLVVFLLVRQLRREGWTPKDDAPSSFKPWMAVLVTVAILAGTYAVTMEITLPQAQDVKPLLAAAMGIFFIGVMGVISYRSLFKQIFCYCIMENSAHMTMAVLAPQAQSLMESGVATDAIFGTIIFAVLIYRIYKQRKTLDAKDMEELRG